jgi:hypothetical protein
MRMIEDLGMQYPVNSKAGKKYHYAIYECPLCGKPYKASVYDVSKKHEHSCGCLKHGLTDHRLHRIWNAMKQRCYRVKNDKYPYYGGRGITVCDEWKNDFMAFYTWSMANGYADDLQVDRKDNDGNYCPENCRWVTRFVNMQNTGTRKQTASGYRGVFRQNNKWRVKICSDGFHYHLGYFDSPEEAALVYNNWVIENKTSHALNVLKEAV